MIRARIRFDRGASAEALADVEPALAQSLEIGEVQVVVPALALRARLRLEDDPAGAEADVASVLERIRGKEVWASYAWSDLGVVLAGLELPFPELNVSSRWIEAARAFATDPAAAAEIYAEIGSRPDEAFARLQAGTEAEVARARAFYREVGASRAASGSASARGS